MKDINIKVKLVKKMKFLTLLILTDTYKTWRKLDPTISQSYPLYERAPHIVKIIIKNLNLI